MTDTPTPVDMPTPENAPDPAPAPAASFSQDDVDRIVKERVARAKATPPADYDDLKTKAAEFDKLREAQKTELEKAQERATQFEQQAKDATDRAHDALLRSAVIAEAARKNVVDPDAAVALLDRSTLEFGDDGAPTNIASAMDSLLKAKPYLVGGGNGRADLGAREKAGTPGQLDQEDLKTMTSAQIVAAQNEGRLDDLLGAKT